MSNNTSLCCFIKKLFSKERLKTTPKRLSSPKGKVSDFEVGESIIKSETETPRGTTVATAEANIIFTINPMLKSHADDDQAATKIQTFYRGHLARKALRALKGLVTLQAIIRGRAVRRQAADMLKCLQSIVNIQAEICARRRLMTQGISMCRSNLLFQDITTQKHMIEPRSESEPPTKNLENDIDTILRKKEDILRRGGVKANSFNQRNYIYSQEKNDPQDKVKYLMKQYLDKTTRNKTCNKEHLPSYMAATKSTRAKATSPTFSRYMTMHFDAYSDGDSPNKIKFSPMSSVNSEIIRSNPMVSDKKKIFL